MSFVRMINSILRIFGWYLVMAYDTDSGKFVRCWFERVEHYERRTQ